MKVQNFDIEFTQAVETLILQYLCENKLDLPVYHFLIEKSYTLKRSFLEGRSEGDSIENCKEQLKNQLFPERVTIPGKITRSNELTSHPFYLHLKQLDQRIVFYIRTDEELTYLLPLLYGLNRSLILLHEPQVNLEVIEEPNYNIIAIEICAITDLELYQDKFMESHFPELYQNYNTFLFLLETLRPEGIVLAESDSYMAQLMSYLSKSKNIPCLVIQKEWPLNLSVFNQNVYHSYFLTWGDEFGNKECADKGTTFIPTGYIGPDRSRNLRKDILFFFDAQSPEGEYADFFLEIILRTSEKHPLTKVLIYESSHQILKKLYPKKKLHNNIFFVSDKPLRKVLESVQIFISPSYPALLEGIKYECVPLFLGPEPSEEYKVNCEQSGLGKMATNQEDFSAALIEISASLPVFLNNIKEKNNHWFLAQGKDAVQKTVDCINELIPIHFLLDEKEPKLHIGCGNLPLKGWINVDIEYFKDVHFLNAGKPYPYPDHSFNYIFSEHLIEHLTLKESFVMLRECYRILKPGGKKRIAMPNLDFLVDMYLHPEKENYQEYINWSTAQFVPEIEEFYKDGNYPPIYVFNNFFHDWGHKFIHSPKELEVLAKHIGFKNIKKCPIGISETPAFQSIERHGNSIPDFANELETVILEMER